MSDDQRQPDTPLRVLAWPSYLTGPNGQDRDPYPRLLYSGLDARGIEIEDFRWARPGDWLRLLAGRADILHMHWPDQVVAGDRTAPVLLARIALFRLLVSLARLKGIRLLWTVHNLRPHDAEPSALRRRFFSILLANLTALVCLSRSGGALLAAEYPEARRLPRHVVPHGHYRGRFPDQVSRHDARRALGIDATAPVVLFLGQIRPYKNVPRLIECFRAIAPPDWRLVIAGQPRQPEIAAAITAAAAGFAQILLSLRFIAAEDLQLYLRASDLVVLPYTDVLNSGAALLALSFDRPVLAPAKGALVDLRDEVGPAWVMTYEEPDLTPAMLHDAMHRALARTGPDAPPLDGLDWERIRDRMAATYRAVARSGGSRAGGG